MKTVWKVGSRWGNDGPRVLDLFLEYGCIFFGDADNGKKAGNWRAVVRGDLFIISDGSTPVAIGEALGEFRWREDSGIPFRAHDVEEFFDGADVVVCPARIEILPKDERAEYWGIDPRKRFCRAIGATEKVNAWWGKHVETPQKEEFDIETRVATLFGTNPLIDENTKYSIPIYQRPYSWGEPELRRLLEDMRQGMEYKDPIFLGTMQLGEPIPLSPDGSFHAHHIIDGQQRLTTFLLLLIVLESLREEEKEGKTTLDWGRNHFRTAVNKRAAQDDLDSAWEFLRRVTPEIWESAPSSGEEINPYIANARILYGLLKEFATRDDDENDGNTASNADIKCFAANLYDYMVNNENIKLVVIETRAGLAKTLKIFDSINSAGMDLGSEDLFKIHFYEYRQSRGDRETVFDEISAVYEMVAEYNRHPAKDAYLSMGTVLGTYQRQIIAENNLNATTFTMSSDRFFNQLFETVLGVHSWPDFKAFSGELTVEALRCVAQNYIAYYQMCADDPELRIWQRMFWETRYGYANDYPVLALVRKIADKSSVKAFTMGLVKSLVPASLYYGKHVYAGRAHLLDLLREIWKDDPQCRDIGAWCRDKWRFEGRNLADLAKVAMDYEIAWTPKWKNLLCKLVELAAAPQKDEGLFTALFQTGFDIEHIQSYTDEKDSDGVRKEWGGELNKIGNLVMLESWINKSIKNRSAQKEGAYGKSHYVAVHELQTAVAHWKKQDAINRREALTRGLCALLDLGGA